MCIFGYFGFAIKPRKRKAKVKEKERRAGRVEVTNGSKDAVLRTWTKTKTRPR